jgi:hypothetical protein
VVNRNSILNRITTAGNFQGEHNGSASVQRIRQRCRLGNLLGVWWSHPSCGLHVDARQTQGLLPTTTRDAVRTGRHGWADGRITANV